MMKDRYVDRLITEIADGQFSLTRQTYHAIKHDEVANKMYELHNKAELKKEMVDCLVLKLGFTKQEDINEFIKKETDRFDREFEDIMKDYNEGYSLLIEKYNDEVMKIMPIIKVGN